MVTSNNLFNSETLNIFCDASIKQIEIGDYSEYIGCPGAVVIATGATGKREIINTEIYTLRNSTNNNSEIRAIAIAVNNAIRYKHGYNIINIFSDSNICVQGLKDWVFNWVNCFHNGKMHNSSGLEVANQEIFMDIINTILRNNISINIYHQKGHVVTNNIKSMTHAKKVFIRDNDIRVDVSDDLIAEISYYNNLIDILTKQELDKLDFNSYQPYTANKCIEYGLKTFDLKEYKKLIGR